MYIQSRSLQSLRVNEESERLDTLCLLITWKRKEEWHRDCSLHSYFCCPFPSLPYSSSPITMQYSVSAICFVKTPSPLHLKNQKDKHTSQYEHYILPSYFV